MCPSMIMDVFRSSEEKHAIVWMAIIERAKQLTPALSAQHMSQIISILGRQRLRHAEALVVFIERIIPLLPSMETRQVVQVVWGLSHLKTKSDLLFKQAARVIASRAHEMNGKELGQVMISYSSLGYFHPQLHDVLRLQLIAKKRKLEPNALTHSLQALSLLRLKQDHILVASLISQTNSLISEFSGGQLAAVLNSYANLNIQHSLCLEVLTSELFLKRNDLCPMGVASVINACARLPKLDSGLLVSHLADKVLVEGKVYGLEPICLSVAGLARLLNRCPISREKIAPVFTVLGRRVGELSLQLQPSQMATLCYSFAKARVRFGPLFYHTPIHMERFASCYSADHFGMILRAYSSIDLRHGPLLGVLMKELPRFVVDEEAYPLREMTKKYLEGMSVGRELHEWDNEPDKFLLESEKWNISQSSEAHSDAKVPPRVTVLVWMLEALAQWSVAHAPSLQILTRQLTLRSKELPPKSCVRVLSAYSLFGTGSSGTGLTAALLDHISDCWNQYDGYTTKTQRRQKEKKKQTRRDQQMKDTIGVSQVLGSTPAPTDMQGKPPLTFKETHTLLAVVRTLRLRPKEHLPLSLLEFARQQKTENLRDEDGGNERERNGGRRQEVQFCFEENLEENRLQELTEDDDEERNKFQALIKRPTPAPTKKSSKTLVFAGDREGVKKNRFKKTDDPSWNFSPKKKREKILDDLFGTSEDPTPDPQTPDPLTPDSGTPDPIPDDFFDFIPGGLQSSQTPNPFQQWKH